jgi:predicted enzyme related to lactoylglutathione lyase
VSNAIHWFEIPVSNLARAQSFYEAILDTRLSPVEQGPVKMAWFQREAEAHGSAGGLIEAADRTPSHTGTLVYLTVPSIDETLARVERSGGRVVLPKQRGDYGSIAHFEDCEGNLIGVFSEA